MKNLRVVLTITSANPELYADLEKMPARLRAERVRTLATLGLAALTNPPAKVASQTDEERKLARALGLAKELLKDI